MTPAARLSAAIEVIRNEPLMSAVRLKFLNLPHYWDEFIYKFATPAILGTPLKDLTIRVDTSIVMVAAGGLMGIRTGVSLMVGAVINYVILAPVMINNGDIPTTLTDEGTIQVGFRAITTWALWCGVAMMTTASLLAFFAKPQTILSAFGGLFGKNKRKEDCLAHIELPVPVAHPWVDLAGEPAHVLEALPVLCEQNAAGLSGAYAGVLHACTAVRAAAEGTTERAEARNALQHAVDRLFGVTRREDAVYLSRSNRDSLAARLVGRRGRFVQGLEGKVVDFAARAVVAPGPTSTPTPSGRPRRRACRGWWTPAGPRPAGWASPPSCPPLSRRAIATAASTCWPASTARWSWGATGPAATWSPPPWAAR